MGGKRHMSDSGKFFGILILVGYLQALLNYPIKWVNRQWIAKLPKDSSLQRNYRAVMKFIVQQHRFLALSATVALIVHIIIQVTFKWVSPSGVIAAALLVLNSSIGAYGFFVRKGKRAAWIYVHRTTAVLLGLAIVNHIFL
jgi:hypothetical protein